MTQIFFDADLIIFLIRINVNSHLLTFVYFYWFFCIDVLVVINWT